MDANIALALLVVIAAAFNWWQAQMIAARARLAVAEAAKIQHKKLDEIYKVADGRLSDALQTIEDLKQLLLEKLDKCDPRIKEAIAKNS